MNNAWVTPVLIFAGVVVSSGVTYAIAKRTASGDIRTSKADELWAESQAMRRELREEVASLRQELEQAQNQITSLKKRIIELEAVK